MSESEGFLSRWSRRKHEAQTGEAAKPETPVENAPAKLEASSVPPTPEPTATPEIPEFDLSKLPSLDQITATTDIRAFLAPGVPAELTRAALRRAWSADPQIREFVGIAENQWDFNAPDGVPGFGSLRGDDVRRLAERILGEDDEASARSKQAGQNPSDERSGELRAAEPSRPSAGMPSSVPESAPDGVMRDNAGSQEGVTRLAATQNGGENESTEERTTTRRSHGGALPQ